MAANLVVQIGNVDMSEYAVCEQVAIRTQAVYAENFTPASGKKRFRGDKVHLSVSFDGLSREMAGRLQTACAGDADGRVTIVYLNPNRTTDVFERPSVNAVIAYGNDNTEYWDVSIEADSVLDGL